MPKAIKEAKTKVVYEPMKEKKKELKSLYTSPKKTVNLDKAKKWAAIQVVKIVLGLPIVPGR